MDILHLPEKVKNIIELGESHFREFKSGFEGPPSNKKKRNYKEIGIDIGKTLVGFANADGGDLLIGVEDDGKITGLDYNEDTIYKLLNAPKTNVHKDTPLFNVISKSIEIDSKTILLFSIDKSTKYIHLTSDGRCLQRSDKETVPVSVEQLTFERQEQLSREYDRQFIDGADLTHLDLELIDNVGSSIAPGFTNEKVLQLLGLAEYSRNSIRLRKACLMLFASDINYWHPRAEVRIMRIEGNEIKTGREYNVVSDETTKGNILELISNAWELLRPHLVETKFAQDALFKQRIMYPEDACREALINAIAHRDYSNEGRNIEIKIFDHRMEVTSPGGLLSNITIDDLKKLEGIHQSRNSLIARVLKEVGYMREMGEGIRRIFNLMKQNDLISPDIVDEKNQFTIKLFNESVFTQEDQQYIQAFDFIDLTRDEMLIILIGKNGNLISPQMIYDHLELSDWDDYRRIIENAQIKGILFNALKDTEKRKIADKKNISKRDVNRLKVRTPKECEDGLKEFLGCLKQQGYAPKITKEYILSLRKSLKLNSIYYFSSPLPYFILLKILNLTDNSNAPTLLLRNIWGNKPKPRTPVKKPVEKTIESKSKIESNKSIYIENIDYGTTRSDLDKLFSKFGEVKNIYIPIDYRTKRGRGFAFVELNTFENSKKAISQLNNSTFKDRKIRLNWSKN